MNAKLAISLSHGNKFPFDASDEWWERGSSEREHLPPRDWAHRAARGIIAELSDRHTIKHAFDRQQMDEDTRKELVAAIAAIMRVALEDALRRVLSESK